MPRIPSDVAAPPAQKAMPLPWTGSLRSHYADPAAPQTPKARRFITLPKRLSRSVSLPSQVPTTRGPESSPESRFSGMKIDFPLSFFGTLVLRVMAGLRWRATTATPLPKEDEDISAGIGPQKTDAFSITTQSTRAPGQVLRRASACLPQRTDAISIETQPIRAPGQVLRRVSASMPQRTDAFSIETQPTRAPGQVLRRVSASMPERTDAISIETQPTRAPGQVLRRVSASMPQRTDAFSIETQPIRAPGQVLRRVSASMPERTDAISIETQTARAPGPGQVLKRASVWMLRRTDAIKKQMARAPGQVLRRTAACQIPNTIRRARLSLHSFISQKARLRVFVLQVMARLCGHATTATPGPLPEGIPRMKIFGRS